MVSDPSSAQVRGQKKKQMLLTGVPFPPLASASFTSIRYPRQAFRCPIPPISYPLRAYEIGSKALKSQVPPRWSFFSNLDDTEHLGGSQRARALLFFHCLARSAFGREAVFGSVRAFRALRTARGPIPSAPFSNLLAVRARSARSGNSEPKASGEARGGLAGGGGCPRLWLGFCGELGGFPRRLRFSTGVNPDTNLSKSL